MTGVVNVFGDWRLPPEALPPDVEATGHGGTCGARELCEAGLILPLWLPHVTFDDNPFALIYRALIYGVALAYLLFGVSIVTDRIITAAEVMASHKVTRSVKLKSGGTTTVKQLFWHPVVASLTFGVAGTSSPEILLPIIEVLHRDFQGDDLGPSLIVGSGAYHLFFITSVCLLSVRESKGKPIKDLHLFFTTASFAILAYLWVYLIIGVFSPGMIELWEALVTLAMFPVLVLCGWVVARRFPQKLWRKCLRHIRKKALAAKKKRRQQAGMARTPSQESGGSRRQSSFHDDSAADDDDDDDSPENEKRRKLHALMQRLKNQFPNKSQHEIEGMPID